MHSDFFCESQSIHTVHLYFHMNQSATSQNNNNKSQFLNYLVFTTAQNMHLLLTTALHGLQPLLVLFHFSTVLLTYASNLCI